MGTLPGNLMRQFKCRYHTCDDSVELYSKHDQRVTWADDVGDDVDHMSINEPEVLAAFVAFCGDAHREIFLRGCTRDYRQSVPSLFRDVTGAPWDEKERVKRWLVYKKLLDELKSRLEGNRWKKEKRLGPVLQHYGIRTPWLDVVRNLYTAIWFANHEFETRGSCRAAVQSQQEYGWISLYAKRSEDSLIVRNFWRDESSRHLRPHVQHGMSLAAQEDIAQRPKSEQDFTRFRIAQVRFPNSQQWRSCGYMLSARFLFPSPEHDDSLRQLRRACIQTLVDKAGEELGGDAFGSVTEYS